MSPRLAAPSQAPAYVPNTDRTGRLGVAYVRTICSQAGIGCDETTGGEDHLATDLTLQFAMSPVRVQVKSGGLKPLKDGTLSLAVSDKWARKWRDARVPTYLIYVRLGHPDHNSLLRHNIQSTTALLHGYWMRVNNISPGQLYIPVANRFTLDTLTVWARDIEAAFV